MNSTPFKVDKNGTEYYHDWTCPRCGGQGGSDAWVYTGYTCYACGGSGTREKPMIYKKYTAEYQAKLDARRIAREEKKRLERVAEFTEHKADKFAEYGFSADGKAYVVIGNTYEIKDALKEAGARFTYAMKWYFSHPTDDYNTVEVDITEVMDIYEEQGTMYWKDMTPIENLIKERISALTPSENESQYIGTVGKREDFEVTYIGSNEWETVFAYRAQTQYLHKFEDADGNILVWKTSYPFWKETDKDDPYAHYERYEVGSKVTLKATVKEHSAYKNVRQTVLTRCKVVA